MAVTACSAGSDMRSRFAGCIRAVVAAGANTRCGAVIEARRLPGTGGMTALTAERSLHMGARFAGGRAPVVAAGATATHPTVIKVRR